MARRLGGAAEDGLHRRKVVYVKTGEYLGLVVHTTCNVSVFLAWARAARLLWGRRKLPLSDGERISSSSWWHVFLN